MKKISLVVFGMAIVFTLAGCGSISNPNNVEEYQYVMGQYTIVGPGPEVDITIPNRTLTDKYLVLKDDGTNYLVVPMRIWEHLDSKDKLPGTVLYFKGTQKPLASEGENIYFEVVEADYFSVNGFLVKQVGLLVPFSGAYAQWGQDLQSAYQKVAGELNIAHSGLLLQLVIDDITSFTDNGECDGTLIEDKYHAFADQFDKVIIPSCIVVSGYALSQYEGVSEESMQEIKRMLYGIFGLDSGAGEENGQCAHLAVEGVDTENTFLCALSSQPCSAEQFTYEECMHTSNPKILLGILPVYDDETVDSIPDWKNGEVLDEYMKTLSMFEATRSDSRFPGVEMIMGRRGCVSGEALSEDIARLVEQDKVQAYITIPCPIDEVAITRGNEELLQTLNRIYSLYLNGMFSGNRSGAYRRSGEDVQVVQCENTSCEVV